MIDVRVFTVLEANQLIPELSRLIEKLREHQEEIERKQVEIDAMELVCDEASEDAVNSMNRELEALNGLVSNFNAAVEQIHSHGCYLKDVELGLIDFYSLVDGRMVLLCWKYGEEEIRYWHEVAEGFAARQPLTEN